MYILAQLDGHAVENSRLQSGGGSTAGVWRRVAGGFSVNRYSAVNMGLEDGVILHDGRISTGNPRARGIEFALWRLNHQTVAFFRDVPPLWPHATAVGAEVLVALASLRIDERSVAIAGESDSSAPSELLAAALATGAVGFGLVPFEEPNLQVQVAGRAFRVQVRYGDPEQDPGWSVVVTPEHRG